MFLANIKFNLKINLTANLIALAFVNYVRIYRFVIIIVKSLRITKNLQKQEVKKMKDKEQIIVGGVDVSGCGHLYIRPEDRVVWCTDYLYGNCGAHPYCTFKQLARKTQELEQYKKSKQASYETMQREWNKATLENRKLKQECEQLKEKLYQIEDIVKPMNEELTEDNIIREIMFILNDCNNLEPSRYRKALEEIEKLINDDAFIRCPIYDDENCNYGTSRKILDIINKAKSDEAE